MDEMTCYAIQRVDFNSFMHDELLERMEDDPELDFDELVEECYDVTVIGHLWADSADKALEQAANDSGFCHSGYWLDFLNAGDGCYVSLRAVDAPDPFGTPNCDRSAKTHICTAPESWRE